MFVCATSRNPLVVLKARTNFVNMLIVLLKSSYRFLHKSNLFNIILYTPVTQGYVSTSSFPDLSAYHVVSRGFALWSGQTKDHHMNGTDSLPAWHAGLSVYEFGSATGLCKRPGSMWNLHFKDLLESKSRIYCSLITGSQMS